MITFDDIRETNRMITENRLDVRTITMGISLRDCAHPNIDKFCQNVYEKITRSAEYRDGVRYPHHQQAHLCHADCDCGGRVSDGFLRPRGGGS